MHRNAPVLSASIGVYLWPFLLNPAAASAASVPFVGCVSYQSGDGLGLLAPRGWYCQGASGSDGAVLFVGPRPIDRNSSGWQGLDGPVIELRYLDADTSGANEIAQIVARIFPEYRAFAATILEGVDQRAPSGPYPADIVTHPRHNVVEYTTPAQTEGLGNFDSWIGKTKLPIRGAAVLANYPPQSRKIASLSLLSARLPPGLSALIPTIVTQFELDAPPGTKR